jgi:hypothetical protein
VNIIGASHGRSKSCSVEEREIAFEIGDDSDLVAILEIAADSREIQYNGYAETFQIGTGTDAGEL